MTYGIILFLETERPVLVERLFSKNVSLRAKPASSLRVKTSHF